MSEHAIDELLSRMAELGAQDLFLTVGAPPLYQVEKRLVPLGERALDANDLRRLAEPFVGGPRAASFAAHPDLDLAHSTPGGPRYRLNVFRQRGALGIVARRVKLEIPPLESLGLPAALAKLALEQRGLVLVTGAAGTGKSTTLAAMVEHRNAHLPGHIVTLEDPIEFVHHHKRSIITQREVGLDTASFHDGLRSALRQAPDVLLIGEVRDRETAEAALRIAETGHLVLATLHATSCIQAIERLLSLFPADAHPHVLMLTALSLAGIVSQRLVARSVHAARVAAVELLLPTGRVRELLQRGDFPALRTVLRESGEPMRSFDQALHELVKAGRVTREEALPYSDSPNDFLLRFRLEEAAAPSRALRGRMRLV